jgi:uncharacterized membrane protein YedE/YeeE
MAVMVVAFGVGLLFSAGLAVSQMINPAVVLGFLDIAGDWNPTLVMVMAGGIVGAVPGFMLARRRQVPVLGGTFQVPTRRDLDARLIGGAVIFGIGWGLAGICPGPAIAGLSTGMWQFVLFVGAMLAGMAIHDGLARLKGA